jgi:poly-D-alanine transfer protein DltD
LPESTSADVKRSFLKNVMSDRGQEGRLFHNEQFAPFYGSVLIENTPNLHAGICRAKRRRRGGSGARCFTASPFGLPGVSPD